MRADPCFISLSKLPCRSDACLLKGEAPALSNSPDLFDGKMREGRFDLALFQEESYSVSLLGQSVCRFGKRLRFAHSKSRRNARPLPDARDDLSCALFQLGWGHIGKREKGFIDGVDLDGIAKLFYDGDNALREVSVESEI